MSTEVPAERIAGDLALAFREGRIRPGEPLPASERLAAVYQVPLPVAGQALRRLSLAGLIRGGADQGTFVRGQVDARSGLALDVMAVPALCRRLEAAPGAVPGRASYRAALQRVSEAYLSAGRRAIRGGLTGQDERLAAEARRFLAAGGQAGAPPPPPWERPPAAGGTPGPAAGALEWPGTVAVGLAAVPASGAAPARRPAPRIPQRPRAVPLS
jgi:hypothetical protein